MTSEVSISGVQSLLPRLDLEEVRQHFVKVLAWARGSQQTTLALQCTRRPEEATALEDAAAAPN